MKTSNKILTGLLVVVFAVPLLLAASLSSKIKKGEFTVEKWENYRDEKVTSGSFGAYKVVKVIAPNPRFLKCVLHASNDQSFNYSKESGRDSVIVSTKNDTLYVRYITLKIDKNAGYSINVRVNLPHVNNLVVDGAEVIIDSFPASSNNMSVILKNKGEIKEGSSKKVYEDVSKMTLVKKDKNLMVAEINKPEVSNYNAISKKAETVKSLKVRLDIKELLLYKLPYRI